MTRPQDQKCVMSGPQEEIPCRRCPLGLMEERGADLLTQSLDNTNAIYLEGNIRLLDELGRGAMGTVFSAVDETLQRMVAVKFLLPELQADAALVKRFRVEAKASASIRNNNVVQIYAFGRHGSSDYFVSEFIDGPTVEKALSVAAGHGQQLPINCALWILDQAAAGLAAVHAAGVVHRDVKPGNLMAEVDTGRIVIMDFGIGYRRDANAESGSESDGDTGPASGTPAYMAPETIAELDDGAGGAFADIYAYGVTAFEILTGRLPFEADDWVSLLRKHLNNTPPAPSTVRPDLPYGLDEVVLRCLAKKPGERYQSFDEVRRALRPVIDLVRTPWRQLHPAPSKARPRKRAASRTPPRGSLSSNTSARVVLAARDMSTMGMVQDRIRRALPGFDLEAARSPARALELAKRRPPRLFIGPMHDSELNGLELAGLVSGESALDGTKLILVGDRFEPGEQELLEALGVIGFISPDDDPESVEETLRRASGRNP